MQACVPPATYGGGFSSAQINKGAAIPNMRKDSRQTFCVQGRIPRGEAPGLGCWLLAVGYVALPSATLKGLFIAI